MVSEAREALERGYADRMMLEVAPDSSFGVLSPAFRGNEGFFACREFSMNGCTFLTDNGCELFDRSFRPLECRYCHHSRLGTGMACHREIGREWNSSKGKRLVEYWLNLRSKDFLIRRSMSLPTPFR
ncbi:MAG: hypothetical protein JW760_06165 [Spirochaetales bacterium]|nr:hypothetical protein [Spirochaetales bacterium]